jgi:SagB-type dehydrogenase family enzyme
LTDVSQLLWAAQGITHHQVLRAAPSAWALYPVEIYLISRNVQDLAPAVYKYDVKNHSLFVINDDDQIEKLYKAGNSQNCIKEAACTMVLCGVYERIAKKNEEHAKEYTSIEVGCIAENVYLQATSRNLGVVFVGGFDPKAVKEILSEQTNEEPMCLMPIGKSE